MKETAPNLPPVPQPVLTRWGSWLSVALYYADHYNEVKGVLDALESTSSEAARDAKTAIVQSTLPADFAYIKGHFSRIPGSIEQLETRNLQLQESIGILDNVLEDLASTFVGVVVTAKEKLDAVLTKNLGPDIIRDVNDILEGRSRNIPAALSANDISTFKYAPLTSCDVERSFPAYKTILTDKRFKHTFEHIK